MRFDKYRKTYRWPSRRLAAQWLVEVEPPMTPELQAYFGIPRERPHRCDFTGRMLYPDRLRLNFDKHLSGRKDWRHG